MALSIAMMVLVAAVLRAETKAVPFGSAVAVQILNPQMVQPSLYNETDVSLSRSPGSMSQTDHRPFATMDDGFAEHYQSSGPHSSELGVSKNAVRPDLLFNPLKRQTIDCGTFIMDCSSARGACNNACFYQNCVKAGQRLRYQDFGSDSWHHFPPCRSLPLSQKMYDTWPDWDSNDPDLQTDEWPMAATVQDDFRTGVIRNTLRCIPGGENSNGDNMYRDFRRRAGDYRLNEWYGRARTCRNIIHFTGDETFEVSFDISGMSSQEVDEVVPYCKPNPDCTNDGRQFHLSKLAYTKMQKSGRWGWPYDIDIYNNYMITGESDPIDASRLQATMIGSNEEQVDAMVSRYRSGRWQVMGRNSNPNLGEGQSLLISGLPRDTVMTRRGDLLEFQYGDPTNANDRLAAFTWNTNDYGFNEVKMADGMYCSQQDHSDGNGNVDGSIWTCSFPGW